jgi:hypothetical protein
VRKRNSPLCGAQMESGWYWFLKTRTKSAVFGGPAVASLLAWSRADIASRKFCRVTWANPIGRLVACDYRNHASNAGFTELPGLDPIEPSGERVGFSSVVPCVLLARLIGRLYRAQGGGARIRCVYQRTDVRPMAVSSRSAELSRHRPRLGTQRGSASRSSSMVG